MTNGNGTQPARRRPCKYQGEHGCKFEYDFVQVPGTKRWRVDGTDYMEHLRSVHAEHYIDDPDGNPNGGATTAVAARSGSGKTIVASPAHNGNGRAIAIRLESLPVVWESFGLAPGGLPRNVSHMFPPALVLEAFRVEWRMKLIVVAVSLGFAWLATYGLKMMPYQAGLVAPLIYCLVAFAFLAIIGPRWTTKTVIVLLRERGRAVYDVQKWLRRDEGKWPDSWRRDVDRDSDWYRGQRLLMIDAQAWQPEDAKEFARLRDKKVEKTVVTTRQRRVIRARRLWRVPVWFVFDRREEVTSNVQLVPDELTDKEKQRVNELLSKIKPYIPDRIAPYIRRPEGLTSAIPFADHTMADMGSAWAVGHDIRVLAGSHTLRKARLKQTWIMIGIGACMAGIAFFSWTTMKAVNAREQLRLQIQAQQAAQAQIQIELQRQLSEAGIIDVPKPVVPADLIPNK